MGRGIRCGEGVPDPIKEESGEWARLPSQKKHEFFS